jgi:excinuclease ABC subunit C
MQEDPLIDSPDDDGSAAAADMPPRPGGGSLAVGVEVIRSVVKTLPAKPGVYRMLDAQGEALYVGKARSLKSRVANYTQPNGLSNRIRRMIAETASMEVVVTHTEIEALLLESNLIKRLMPRYNVLLRDDKSFPFILIAAGHDFPQLRKHRGARNAPGEYFGPFASAGSVSRTLVALQRAFLLRSCNDSVFSARTRPCLLYQIKRCSAPCVGRIDKDDYARLIDDARNFLTGRSKEVQQKLAERMTAASDALDFEAAALIRDRIRALTQIQGHQAINVQGVSDADVIAAHQAGGQTCVQVFFFRGGQNWGNRAYFPSHDRNLALGEILASFVGQFYENKPPPRLILLNHPLDEQELVGDALSSAAGHRVEIAVPKRGEKADLVAQAAVNAREALERRMAESATQRKLLDGVARVFGLPAPPRRIEVYDNSHIQGTNAVGAMIVAGPDGFTKNAYRKFNIRGGVDPSGAPSPVEKDGLAAAIDAAAERAGETVSPAGAPLTPGDDYGMMREVLSRRFARAIKEDPEREQGSWPDLLLIDGGAGQLSSAQQVLADLGIHDIPLVGIAKGPDRDAGRERFFMPGRPPFSLETRDPVLYFLQRLRDEAHRFAIGTHRAKRAKALTASPLDEIPGIGARRKKALLHHFGSARAVSRAGLADLEMVEGISRTVAKKIYDHFHAEG